MKRNVALIVLVLFLLVLISCSSPIEISRQTTWEIIQSPLTGRYYEVVIVHIPNDLSKMGINEQPRRTSRMVSV